MNSLRQWRDWALIIGPTLLFILAGFALAYQYVEPPPPRQVAMTTGTTKGAYSTYGEKYATALKHAGVTLEVRPSAGSIENLARLSDPASGVQVGLVQGGLADETKNPELTSLGRMFLEPLWVFYRSDFKIERLSDLKGLRIAVGPEGSGTRPLVTTLLGASGIDASNATFLGASSVEAAQLLRDGTADVIFFTMAAEADLVRSLLHAPKINVLSFDQAEALTRLFPFLVKIMLPAGVVDLAQNIPAHDVTLVAPAASLVVRRDLHPAIIGLLVGAAKEIHAGSGLFQKAGEYPQPVEAGLSMNADAERYYRYGPPFLQRYMPFALATFLERMRIMIIPIAGVLIPLGRILPMLYQWRIKHRIFRWYDQLKHLERDLRADKSPERVPQYLDRIHAIEDQVSQIKVPRAFSDQLYNLRSAIDLVRQRIAALQSMA